MNNAPTHTFPAYSRQPDRMLRVDEKEVAVFDDFDSRNIDEATVSSFGEEWKRFNAFDAEELRRCGDQYFDLVKEEDLPAGTVALDAGCGSGRWSWYLAPRVSCIEAIDPSDAVIPAVHLLHDVPNVRITRSSIDAMPFADGTFDFIMSIGVLHHMPDTQAALITLRRKLKPQGRLLVYLYYDVTHRGLLFRTLFNVVNGMRTIISSFPTRLKEWVCECIALLIYWPMARFSRLIQALGFRRLGKKWPLSYYAEKGFFIMRNDALDRFGTPLEKRFTSQQITTMLTNAGFSRIRFSDGEPYWHVLAEV
jgi:ubiquinone/menaquinone biosynthesis C-methylase UbiE